MDVLTKIGWLIDKAKEGFERPYSLSRAAEYLNISKSHLYKLTHTNQIVHSKPTNGKLYFEKSDLDRWAFSNKITSREPKKVSNDKK